MDYLILTLALAALVGCYDIAWRASLRTRHSMRLAVIVIGVGCVVAMFGEYDWALVVILTGCGLYRIFDRREEGWHRGRTDSIGVHPVADAQAARTGPADEPADPRADAVGSVVSFSTGRQHHGAVARRAG